MPAVPIPAQAVLAVVSFALTSGMVLAWAWAIGRFARGLPLLPRRESRVVPWGVGSVLVVIVVSLAVNFTAGMIYSAVVGGGGRVSPRALLVVMAGANLVQLVLFPLTLRLTSGARLADFGLGRRPDAIDIWRGAVGCLLMVPIVYGLLTLLTRIWEPQRHPLEEMVKANPTGSIALIAFVSGVVLAPAAEELLFRGILQGWLERACSGLARKPRGFTDEFDLLGHGPGEPAPIVLEEIVVSAPGEPRTVWSAPLASLAPPAMPPPAAPRSRQGGLMRVLPNVVTSLLFAGLHSSQWPAPIPLFFLSLAMGELYRRTGGLVAPFTLHATFNGLSTLMLYLALLSGVKPPPKVPETAPAPLPAAAPSRATPRSAIP